MPELPEAEVVRRGIEQWTAGSLVERVAVHDPRSLRRHVAGAEDFAAALTGARLLPAQRRGKFLWIPLCEPGREPGRDPRADESLAPVLCLAIHLGMSGQVLISAPEDPRPRHLRIEMDLRGALQEPRQLRFVDQRIFGGMHLTELLGSAHPSGSVPATAAHIAPDALEPEIDAESLYRMLRGRRTGIKRALLDQQMLSGIGNIYADEALWRARLHYARPTETVTRREAATLLQALQHVLRAALEAGGTSFDALYVNVNGASGYFDRSLQCYGQAGRHCSRCQAVAADGVIRRDPFMGRSSYFCPRCQPRPRRARW